MKVYILTTARFPYGMAETRRVICYSKGLIENNYECEVIVARKISKYDRKFGNNLNKGEFQSIEYTYVPGVYHESNYRFLNSILFRLEKIRNYKWIYKYLKKKSKRNQIIISYYSDTLLGLIIIYLCRKYKLLNIKELCEIPYINRSLYATINRYIDFKFVFPFMDGFFVISEQLKIIAEKYKSKKAFILKVPIMINTKDYINKFALSAQGKNSAISDPYIIHTGTFTETKDGMMGIIKAFKLAIQKIPFDIKLVITGDAKNSKIYPGFISYIKENSIESKIVFTGIIPMAELDEYLENASLAIINKYDNFQNRYCFSTKLAEYLAYGIAVITTDIGEANNYLVNNYNAYIVKNNSEEDLANAIIEAFCNEKKRLLISRHGFMLAKNVFNYSVQGKNISKLLTEVMSTKKA